MTRRPRPLLLAALAAALAAVMLPVTSAAGADRPDPAAEARHRLTSDASGGVRIVAGRSGRVAFVGTTGTAEVDNPAVPRGASVAAAARAHLDRYGAILGATGDTEYARRSTTHTASGVDVVGYTQQVDGVPVVGGDVVVSMAPDRGLRSIQSTVSTVGSVGPAVVTQADAAATALGVVRRDTRSAHLQVTSTGRWLLDPQVVEVSMPSGARTAWRFEVGDGTAVRQLVLVDDHTGRVLLRSDLVERSDRAVCDRDNVPGDQTVCAAPFARAEGDPTTSITDVDDAYDLSGVVSDFYEQVAGVDLTQLLGIDVGGVKKLASTVRFCTTDPSDDCPYSNAFWNGQQMFYGDGWAGADDVVGHEMTHGFIDHYSGLFYWGQPGAINESMADVIGEIIDHRHPSVGDSAGDWRVGEDSPWGPLRSLSDPTDDGQPDAMTSPLYTADEDYADNGGVHTNSGVGNKTAYLISQGGSFNGQTITGIDGADPSLSKTAKLYVDVIERLGSGADFAALAAQLDQSCQDLLAAGSPGFTPADCTAVHQAGVATELTTPPTFLSTRPQADSECPPGYTKRILFDSEAGDPASAFTADVGGPTGWRRDSTVFHDDTWFVDDPETAGANSLVSNHPVVVPAGQPTYLTFRGWWVLDFVPPGWADSGYYDGGTVSLLVDGSSRQSPAAGWVNGPSQILSGSYGSPGGGWAAFSGDSRGWVRSRLDLGGFGGHSVQPLFTLRSDDTVGLYGWAVDDITIYTCERNVPSVPQGLRVMGTPDGATLSWSPPASFPGLVTGYTVQNSLHPGSTVLPSTTQSWHYCCAARRVSSVTLSVSASWDWGNTSGPASIVVVRGLPSLMARRRGTSVTFRGSVSGGGQPVTGGIVLIEREFRGVWHAVGRARVRADGRFVARIRHARRAYYRANFKGWVGFMGTPSARHRW